MAELDEDLRMLDELDSSSDQNKKGPPDPLSAKIAGSRSDLLADSVSITSFRSSSWLFSSNNFFLFTKESRFSGQPSPKVGHKTQHLNLNNFL